MQILYDKDWTHANVKPLIAKSYGSPERVDIRTEAHVVEGDIYLSRATSAFSRHDFMSSHLFATVALENTLKVLVEITMQPFSNGRFIETVESSCTELGKHDLFEDYIKMTGFRRDSSTVIKDRLRLFQKIWEEMNSTIKQNGETLASVHFRVRTRLNYYFNDAYLRGVVDRANAMLEAEKTVEALHYLTSILLDIVENYVWLKSFMRKVRIDCTTLIRSLESLEGKGSRNYVNTLTFLELEAIGKSEVAQDVSKARELMLRTRKERKQLIKSRLLKS